MDINAINKVELYSQLPVDKMNTILTSAGLDKCPDLYVIKDLILNSTSIMDIGFGSGRAIKYIRSIGYNKKITAIDCCDHYYQHVKNLEASNTAVKKANILTDDLRDHFDLCLSLWNGICDFAEKEQCLFFQKVVSYMKPNGYLAIDYFAKRASPINGKKTSNGLLKVEQGGYAYFADQEKLISRIESYGLTLIEKRAYQTMYNPKELLIFQLR